MPEKFSYMPYKESIKKHSELSCIFQGLKSPKGTVTSVFSCETFQQFPVHLRLHYADADVAVVQKRKCGTVPDHHFFPYGPVKEHLRGNPVVKTADQYEVGAGRVGLEVRLLFKITEHVFPFRGDQIFGLFNIFRILKHDLSR